MKHLNGAVFAVVGLVATIFANPAPATILFAGGEDLDGSIIGTVTVDTTAGRFRSGYARSNMLVAVGSGSDPSPNRFVLPSFANQSVIWIHAENYTQNNSTYSNGDELAVFGSDGYARLVIRGTGTNGQVKISTRNTSGTFVDLVTCTTSAYPTSATLTKLDWYVNYAVSGQTTLYANGVQICNYTGDITTNSITAVNQVYFGNSSAATDSWSEMIISTTDTRSMNLFTCAPQANGHTMAWTGSYTNVNPTTINDASSITTGSNAQIAQFTCPSLPSGTFTVPAVTQSARVQIGSSGPSTFYFIARPGSGSTDYNNGSTTSGTTNFTTYYNIWPTNPATSSAWGTSDLGAGTNFGLESEP